MSENEIVEVLFSNLLTELSDGWCRDEGAFNSELIKIHNILQLFYTTIRHISKHNESYTIEDVMQKVSKLLGFVEYDKMQDDPHEYVSTLIETKL